MKINELKTPCYVIDEGKLTENLKILHHVMQRTGAKILLAQKAFSAFCEYPLIGKYLSGTTASGLYEARLAQEEMGKENHVFCPAYLPEEMDELVKICDHIVFNSVSQFLVHKEKIKEAAAGVSTGLRINPECSTQEGHEIYDPCGTGSRLGITRAELDKAIQNGFDLSQIDGFHFHTLCEQNSDALKRHLMPWKKSLEICCTDGNGLIWVADIISQKPVTTWKNWRTVSGACRKHMTLKFILSRGRQ